MPRKVPQYDVSLRKSASTRWSEIIDNHEEQTNMLLDNALEPFDNMTGIFAKILKKLLSSGYKLSGGHFQDDIDAWAEGLGRTRGEIVTANIAYELQTLLDRPSVFGCTAVAIPFKGGGYVHVRNMDWKVEGINESTILVTTKKGSRKIHTVTIPALVGALSGMVPNKFSVTLNFAPASELPGFDLGPLFLLRWVLENAKDFDEAVEYLSNTKLSAPAFFMVTGPLDACVVERTRKEAAVRWANEQPLILTNHYVCEEFEHLNNEETLSWAEDRYEAALKKAKKFKGGTVKGALKVLADYPVNNDDTEQRMAFHVPSGTVEVL